MNPPAPRGRAPSRFIRGRGRGGGGYRPYFYFRRNGRVIPARGNRQPGQEAEAGTSAGAAENRLPPARGWNRPASKRGRDTNLDCSFLRPENYAAPEDGLQVQSIAVDNPKACPGWRLYFLRDTYTEDSDQAKRITAVEAHYQRNPQKYDFVRIREQGFFKLPALGIVYDEQLKKVWPRLAEDLREHPQRSLSTLAVAMHTVVINHNLDANDTSAPLEQSTLEQYVPPPTRTRKIYVRPEDFTPVELTTGISADRVDTLFSVRGIVSSVGEPTYSIAWQSFRCSRCQTEQAMRQRGSFQPRPYHCKQAQCVAKDSFVPLRSSPYTRISAKQIVRLEESSLSLIADYDSILPGEIDVELRHDLVDCVHVGQEIVVNGVLKLRDLGEDVTTATGSVAGDSNELKAYLKAASVQDARHKKREFSERDLEAIAMINAEPNSFKLLVQSLAPEVHGHELPKAACLLSLLGGGAGGVNVLLVGDPGIGKSKILQNCAQITERGSHISGKRGAQSAQRLGPTFTGRNKRVLQAGGLMTASSPGHCTLDDVDKLASKQAVLLQCMQSGEINMPLPGAFSTFLAQPSIIACANPQRGQYDEGRYLLQNIHIVPSLLKEFHLVYVLLDKPSVVRDISLTAHVRALHAGAKKRAQIAARYALKPKTSDSMCEGTFYDVRTDDDSEDNDSIMQQDYDLDKRLELQEEDAELDLLPPILIKKFLAYARQNVNPLLNEAASRSIERFFMELREGGRTGGGEDTEQSQLGSGQLLGLIHLSQARARLDLSNVVTPQHVRDVIALLTESITQTSLRAEGCGEMRRGSRKVAAAGGGGRASQLRNFVHMMQLRAVALGRRIFEFEELKEIGTRAGILTGISQLVEIANMGGHLLKKGVNMYEVVPD
ncbi:DNA replication licensing factor REC [Drosophila pseudoobscura]|uniref:DNA replication licensing factor REC n=1 Tax=Drosophila pseudoobscura pseudoobscura TaxID=46245 RepID=A0A6I8UQW0_DROPS|nr:DNA replication licensing factor REC [Drosophila pseudoobscura]